MAKKSTRAPRVLTRTSDKQSYGIFVTNVDYETDHADIKGVFPIRYFNVLSPD